MGIGANQEERASLSERMRAEIRGLPAVERAEIDESLHRMQWNESAYDFPADLKEEVLQQLAARAWSRYPLALRPFRLTDALARTLGVEPNQIVAAGGSSEVIRVVMSALLGAGDAVVMPTPTFLLYRRYARMLGARICEIQLHAADDFALPVDSMIEAARAEQARAVVLCAPNNPTGTVYAQADVARLAAGCACAVVIDEAYLEFSGQELLPLVETHPNIILIRTFSKAYRMAGVRVGYAVAAAEVAAQLQKGVNSFALSVFQEVVAEVALAHAHRFADGVAEVIAERERLAAGLRALPGVIVFGSGTNFLLVQPACDVKALIRHLLEVERVLVSDNGGYAELAGMLRVTVGTPEENDMVLRGFAACCRD
jgi:histidinol-phosphate aminotransferase